MGEAAKMLIGGIGPKCLRSGASSHSSFDKRTPLPDDRGGGAYGVIKICHVLAGLYSSPPEESPAKTGRSAAAAPLHELCR